MHELQRLLSELLDGQLSEDGQRALAELLRDKPEALDAYCNFMSLHALLHLDLCDPEFQLLPPLLQTSASEMVLPTSDKLTNASPSFRFRGWIIDHPWRIAAGFMAIAASILFVMGWLSNLRQPHRADNRVSNRIDDSRAKLSSADEAPIPTTDGRAVAVLGQASRANWSDPNLPIEMGSSLTAGTYKLEQGVVLVEFFSGASVIIQAPAEFELVSPTRIECKLGKVRAHVPSQARGFTVETPNYSAVDLGTEFTVEVQQTGASQFQVLDGEVQLWDGRIDPAVLAQHLTTGQGMQADPAGVLKEILASPSQFIGHKRMSEMAAEAMLERYEEWRQFSARTRTAPDVILYYGFDGNAPWERVLRNETGDGESRDGAIVGCQWTAGRWNGKQALEFKRTSDRVRLSIPGEFKSLTLATWLRVEGLERWLSSLMLTDGHELGEVHWQMTDLGQLMLGVKAEPERSHDFYSPSIIGPGDLGRWVHLACVYNGADRYVCHYLDGAEVSREPIRRETTLRIGAAEIGNWVPQDLKDYRIRSLNGRIDEFILFDSPLTGDEIREIYESGKPQA
jgi:hypothetical protein